MKRFLLVVFIAFTGMVTQAQLKVNGVITSGEDKQPLPGANVIIKGTTTGTIADFDGRYSLDVPSADAVLVFSFIGYTNQEVPVNGRSQINVEMISDVVSLDAVVVVGYGTQRKADLTSAISTLKPQEVLKMPGGVSEALQGAIPGVNVSAGKIRIRGVSTITGNSDPLWVVDGLIGGSVPDENEIESIQVLKDAASSAIYGIRGANGVIIVTTKKGKKGEPTINYNGYSGTGTPWNKLEMLDAYDYGVYVHELFYNYYGDGYLSNVPENDLEPSQPIANTDWQDEFFQRSFYQKHNVSISGGTDNMSFRTGINYSGNRNSIVKSGSESKGIYSNVNFEKGWFTLGQNLNVSMYDTWNGDGNFFDMLRQPSNIPVYSDTTEHGFYITGTSADGNDMVNQVARNYLVKNRNSNLNIKGNLFTEVNLFKLVKYKFNLGFDIYRQHTEKDRPAYELGKEKYDVDYYKEGTTRTDRYVYDHTLSFDQTYGQHHVTAMAGVSTEVAKSRSFGAEGEKDIPSILRVLDQYQANPGIYGSAYEDAMFSILGRATYSFKGKYLLTANIRRDASSNFSKNKRWGTFPSVSAGWRISDEAFFRDALPWVDNFKLRATWGYIGNQSVVDRYTYQSAVSSANLYYTFGPEQNSDDSNAPAPLVLSFANPDLGWETTRDAGVGFDLDMFRSKINMVFDFYNRQTTDVILAQQLPLSSGTRNEINVNAGEIRNWGIEYAITYRDQAGDFNWSVSPNIAINRNNVYDVGDFVFQGGETDNGFVTSTFTGTTVGEFYGYKTGGLFKTQDDINNYTYTDVNGNVRLIQPNAKPGDIKFLDLNNNGNIDEGDKTSIGSPIPTMSIGLNMTFDWKGFDFSMMWQGDFGNDIYNNGKTLIAHGISPVNQQDIMLDRFRAQDITLTTPSGEQIFLAANTNTDVPRAVFGDPNGNMNKASDYFIEDGSYFRLKRITLGYTLPENLMNQAKIQNLRFYIGAKNLITFTNYSLFDPEVRGMEYEAGGAQINRGIDFQRAWGSTNAVLREFFVGVQLTF
ncbi:MAG: SusC/RagA family TonB-linked outer membrane protein [Salinivirgaceae bacterium]